MKTISFTALGSIALLLVAATTQAQEQSFRSERLRLPASLDDGLVVQLPNVEEHLHVSAALTLGYASQSLVSSVRGGDFALVDSRFGATAAVALGLGGRFEVSALLPATLNQDGEDPSSLGLDAPAAAGVGELELGGSALLVDRSAVRLGLAAALALPTGSTAALASDGAVSGEGRLLFSYDFKYLVFAADSGLRFRPDRRYRGFEAHDSWLLRAGVHVPLADRRLRAMLELDAETGITSDAFFDQLSTPVELLLGGRYAFDNGMQVGPALGFGLNGAPTTPRWRALATLGWSGGRRVKTVEPDAVESRDPCAADPAACRPVDDDGDGIANASDRCPDQPEDLDGHADADGCADLDNDDDGVADSADRCPLERETTNGFEDDDGCADVPAASKLGTVVPEPELPARPLELPRPIGFDVNSASVSPAALPSLQKIADLMNANPALRIEVSGHSSSDGNKARNFALARERANNVVRWLIERGIPADRLKAVSRSAETPRADDATDAGRNQNRRVEFKVLAGGAEGMR